MSAGENLPCLWCIHHHLPWTFTWWSGPLLHMACTSQPWFLFNFKTEELVHSVLCAMWDLGHNSPRINTLWWKIDRLLLYLWLLEITKVRIRFQNYSFKADKRISYIHNLSREYNLNLDNIFGAYNHCQNLIVPIVLS